MHTCVHVHTGTLRINGPKCLKVPSFLYETMSPQTFNFLWFPDRFLFLKPRLALNLIFLPRLPKCWAQRYAPLSPVFFILLGVFGLILGVVFWFACFVYLFAWCRNCGSPTSKVHMKMVVPSMLNSVSALQNNFYTWLADCQARTRGSPYLQSAYLVCSADADRPVRAIGAAGTVRTDAWLEITAVSLSKGVGTDFVGKTPDTPLNTL